LRSIFQRRYVFHLFFWLMCIVFAILEMQGFVKKRGWGFAIFPLLTFIGSMAVLVYINILVLMPHLLQKRKVRLYIGSVLVLIVLYVWLRSEIARYWDAVVWPDDLMSITDYFKWNAFYAVWFILISSMLYFSQKWTEQQQQVKNIQINQLQTELKYLRAQVNPHFLFNGLNTVYGSIDKTNQEARNTLLQFADLLRYNLYEADVDWVELEKETLYLENYVALQRARSNSNLQIELTIQAENKSVKIAPLIFIPFVENAFKFSSHDDNKPNSIRINLQQSGNRIIFQCANSYEDQAQVPGGIGLVNVKRRLELLYKDRYILDIRNEANNWFVELILITQ
jgi:two-component system, LytTR family, sensor kinase